MNIKPKVKVRIKRQIPKCPHSATRTFKPVFKVPCNFQSVLSNSSAIHVIHGLVNLDLIQNVLNKQHSIYNRVRANSHRKKHEQSSDRAKGCIKKEKTTRKYAENVQKKNPPNNIGPKTKVI